MKFIFKPLSVALAGTLLVGCASKSPNVDLSSAFWKNHKQVVVVAHNKIVPPQLYKGGDQGLIDILINDAVSNRLQSYLGKLKPDVTQQLNAQFIKRFNAKHIAAKSYTKTIDTSKLPSDDRDNKKYAVKKFTALKMAVGSDKLLIVSVNALGVERKYMGFIPLGAPRAVCNLSGKLVDLNSNKILWRHNFNSTVSVKGPWDQPPRYKNLTIALNKAIVDSSQNMLDQFFQG